MTKPEAQHALEPLRADEMDDIDAMHARLGGTYYALLGVAPDCDRPTVRAAYFALMKRFHPDVFWERDLGLYRPRVEAIFQRLTTAFEVLCDHRRRAEYDATLAAPKGAPRAPSPPVATRVPRTTGVVARPPAPEPKPPAPSDVPPSSRPLPANESTRSGESVRPPTPDPVPRQITLQSLLRTRNEHLAKQRRDRAAEIDAKAREAEKRNDNSALIALLREGVALSPDDADFRRRLADAEAARSQLTFDRCVSAARVHERDGRWDAAVGAWTKACAERPKDLAAHLGMVNASCEGLVDLAAAADYARRATQIDPKSADAWALLARVFFLAGRMASARGAVESALKIQGTHAAALDLARKLKMR